MKRTGSAAAIGVLLLLSALPARAQLLDAVALDTVRTYRSMERALKDPDKVYRLDLSGAKLKELPVEIYTLKNLNALDISGNKLKELPERLGEFVHLQELRASRNKLEQLPAGLCKLVHLKRIDVSRNALTGLPGCIGALTEMVSMDLWDNDLAEFPEEMADMLALRFMDLRAIQFEEPEMEHIQMLVPKAKVYFSQPCNCGM